MFLVKSNRIKLHGVAASLQGGRPENQDDLGFLDTPLGFLFIICDGMGGGPGGKTASYIVKYEVAQVLSECSPQMPRENAIKMAVSKANEALFQKMEEVPQLNGMGSTFVAVLIDEHSAMVAHAGDSRCYRMHGRRLLFRTQDHSLVGELVRKKALTEEQARTSPQANVISRGLGSTSNHVPEIEEVPYRKGDRFILCTDGVWGSMPHKDLLKRFSASADEKLLVGNLSSEIDRIGQAKGGHHDNHTIAVIEMDCNSRLRGHWSRLTKIILGAAVAVAVIVAVVAVVRSIGGHQEGHVAQVVVPQRNIQGGSTSFVSPKGDGFAKVEPPVPSPVNADSMDKVVKAKLDSLKQAGESSRKDTSKVAPYKLAQDVVTTFESALSVKDKEGKKAQDTMYKFKKQAVNLLEQLREQVALKEIKSQVDSICSQATEDKSWYVTKDPDKDGYYKPTGTVSKILQSLKEKAEGIRNLLEKTKNNGNDKTSE